MAEPPREHSSYESFDEHEKLKGAYVDEEDFHLWTPIRWLLGFVWAPISAAIFGYFGDWYTELLGPIPEEPIGWFIGHLHIFALILIFTYLIGEACWGLLKDKKKVGPTPRRD
ncbi:hypothetical protein EON79_13815 [bacterium]|nr:MAG: hypothetical protein EON79_13815 [bacterium]